MADVTTMAGVGMSMATAAVAGLAAAGQPAPLEAAVLGIKLVHIGFGAIGAAVTISVVQEWSWSALLATLATGLALAGLGTPIAAHYAGLPAAIASVGESAIAAGLGLVGVYVIPAAISVGRALRANPLGMADWVRGRGSPPADPPADPPKGGQP